MSKKALEMDKLIKTSLRRYISSIKTKDPNISKLKDKAMKLVDEQFFPVSKPTFYDNRITITPNYVWMRFEPKSEVERLNVLITFLSKYFFLYKTNSTDNLVCPICMNRFKLEGTYTFEDIVGCTCNCSECGGLLVVDDSGIAPFHKKAFNDTDGLWPKDGNGTGYVEF